MTHQEVRKKEEGLSYIKMILGKCKAKLVASEISLKDLGKAFELLQIKYPEEYGKLDLPLLAATMALPVVKRNLAEWDPLSHPSLGSEQIHQWKKLTAYDVSYMSCSVYPNIST